MATRDESGRFAIGNAGGPGRPRRTIESAYMAALGDAVSLDDWQAIVSRAVADAKAGESKARDWLTRYLIGSTPPSLLAIAAREERSASETDDPVDEIDQEATRQRLQQRREERFRNLDVVTKEILDGVA